MRQRINRRICLSAELESLGRFRNFIDSVCKEVSEIDSQVIYDLKLAMDEACSNIIIHGYVGMNPGSIILNLDLDAERAVMAITDFGHPFEPSEASKPDVEAALEDRPMGGFGLYFIYQTMDQVGYRTTEDGNHLTLIKNFSEFRRDGEYAQ
jgi:serine/threonine-protein kinase RsbW